MLILLSPSKTQDFSGSSPISPSTQPQFLGQTQTLVEQLQSYSIDELAAVLKVSPKLAELNFSRYLDFNLNDPAKLKACIFAYQGDVYQSLGAESLSKTELDFADQHLLILSGLYGALRPLDGISAYRLEMASPLAPLPYRNLYDLWHGPLQDYLGKRLLTENCLVNLASKEYSQVFDFKAFAKPVINVDFKDWNNDRFKTLGLFAKRARGMMARFIFQNKLQDVASLKEFCEGGYEFQPEESSPDHFIFHRKRHG